MCKAFKEENEYELGQKRFYEMGFNKCDLQMCPQVARRQLTLHFV